MAFGKLTAKAVIRKVLGIHGFSQADINVVSKSLPKKLNLTLKDCEDSKIFVEHKKKYPDLFNAMYRLEGTIDHASQHAAGVLITPRPVNEFVPTMFDAKTNTLVSCFDKYMLEEVGLYKFDLLKLTTLNVIDDTLKLVKQNKEVTIDFDEIDKNDQEVYQDLCDGKVFGVFQLDTQRDMTVKVQPKSFEALTALNALIRPGVGNVDEYVERMNGKEFDYVSDMEKSYMAQTYDTITYQEQIMMRVHTLAGWSLGKGDSLRKVKNIRNNMDLRDEFIYDCQHREENINSLDFDNIETAWEEIVEALEGGYSFNASHAACYADISYQTAWLKHYYTLEFMCALMTSERTDQIQISERIRQCTQMGIKILPPDIRYSKDVFTIEGDCIRISLSTIKGVGENAILHLMGNSSIATDSFGDFLGSCDTRVVDKTVVTNMVYAGCFDYLNSNRNKLLSDYYAYRGTKRDRELASALEVKECNNTDKAKMEKQVLGFYVSHSPYQNYSFQPLDIQGEKAIIGGEIAKIKTIIDKSKREMAFITIATEFGNVEVVAFANQYATIKDTIKEDSFVMVTGRRDKDKMLLNTIKTLE